MTLKSPIIGIRNSLCSLPALTHTRTLPFSSPPETQGSPNPPPTWISFRPRPPRAHMPRLGGVASNRHVVRRTTTSYAKRNTPNVRRCSPDIHEHTHRSSPPPPTSPPLP